MMKFLSLIVSFSLIVAPMPVLAQAAPEKIQKDQLQIGVKTSLLPKEIIFDAGEGASNKKISLDPSDNEFDLNSSLNITGDLDASGALTGASSSVSGSSVHQSGITLGSGADASKQITVDRAGFDPYLKWNETTGKWVFSPDGTNEKNFGSGSGGEGGVNLLQNPSFEDGISVDWTSSGGTFSLQTYANLDPSGNDNFYARLVASGAGQYFENTAKTIPSNLTGGCLAKINYNTTDVANWKLQVYDGSSNLLKEETLQAKSWQNGYASFPCPASGTTVKLRTISIAAGQIEADKGHLGSDNRTFQTSQASFYGGLKYPGIANCIWATTSTSTVDFAADTDCATPTTYGYGVAPSTKVPQIDFTNMEKGEYLIIAKFQGRKTAVNNGAYWQLKDETGSILDGRYQFANTIDNHMPFTLIGRINLATKTTKSFKINASVETTGTAELQVANSGMLMEFQVYRYPTESETALRPEAQDWFIDANIGGANPALGTSSVTSYTELTSNVLDMVINSGSAAAKIPCSGTNPATGLTCSAGNEGLGVVFTPPQANSYYEVCAYFGEYSQGYATNQQDKTFQLVETTPSTQTIIQEGKTRSASVFRNDAAATSAIGSAHHSNCGSFYFRSVSEKTIRLMYELSTSGGTSQGAYVFGDRSANGGQRDVRITVKPLLTAYNRPYLLPNESFRAITSNYTATSTDQVISHSGSSATLTIPSGVTLPGKIYSIRSVGGNQLTVQFSGGETIDGLSTFKVSGGSGATGVADSVKIQSTGSGWIFLDGTGTRSESCQINNNGTATSGNNLCSSWATSFNRSGTGLVTISYLTGTFSDVPVCNASTVFGTGTFTTSFFILGSTSLGIANALNGTGVDRDVTVNCRGKR